MRKIEFSESARRTLLRLNKPTARRISNKIDLLLTNPRALDIKKLKGDEGLFRIRVGSFRVIFEIHGETILVTKIGDRKDIYK